MTEIKDANFYKSVAREAIEHGEFCDQDIMNEWEDHEHYLQATYGISEEEYEEIMKLI